MESIIDMILNTDNQVYQMLIAVILGVVVGLRREMLFQSKNISGLMGVRTLPLFALLGVISTFFPEFPYLPVLFFAGLFVLIFVAYLNGVFKLHRFGLTSEILGLLMFWVGVLVGIQKAFLAIILTVILAIFTAYKDQFHGFAKKISLKEWSGALQLIVITAVVLPILPREAIDINPGIFIPFDIWFLVILISGIGFVGYFLDKFFSDRKSILITSVLGSLVSSTATSISIANRSKKNNKYYLLAAGFMITIVVMQLRVAAEIFFLSSKFSFSFIAPSLVMATTSLFFSVIFYLYSLHFTSAKLVDKAKKLKSPFEIIPALKFAVLFVGILYAIYYMKLYLGDMGAYLVAAVGSLTDADAIIFSVLESYKTANIDTGFLLNVITITVVVNTLVKLFYVFVTGKRVFLKKIVFPVLIVVLFGFITYLIVA